MIGDKRAHKYLLSSTYAHARELQKQGNREKNHCLVVSEVVNDHVVLYQGEKGRYRYEDLHAGLKVIFIRYGGMLPASVRVHK